LIIYAPLVRRGRASGRRRRPEADVVAGSGLARRSGVVIGGGGGVEEGRSCCCSFLLNFAFSILFSLPHVTEREFSLRVAFAAPAFINDFDFGFFLISGICEFFNIFSGICEFFNIFEKLFSIIGPGPRPRGGDIGVLFFFN
jgi:hypothetical protein